ncbi:putative BTB/POZ domain-containing protein [Powai lake megavirus]|uniref:Putative BTB/POZ domain-containing protein n=1 Tax=Powai lake megavirus TaxID=1842663 RepID=A0A161HV02_9VIRU|nr:putative BTB/POZ domain-containing protein [Powai lake megavirus]ANB51000.1 putative BTB/POZ domain-containing protein [Powai lake megavirus]
MDNIYNDLTIILKDDYDNHIPVSVNRESLSNLSDYFNNLLTKYAEKDHNMITVYVPHAVISAEIISICDLDFKYNGFVVFKKNWKYWLELAKCYDYFGIEFDNDIINELRTLIIPPKGFDLLIDLAETLNYQYLIPTLIRNLPDNFNLTNLSNKLLTMILQHCKNCYFISANNSKKIRLWNTNESGFVFDNYKTDANIYQSINNIHTVCYSPNGHQFVAISDASIEIIDADTEVPIIITDNYAQYIVQVFYTTDSSQIIANNIFGHINIIESVSGSLIKSHKLGNKSIECIAFCPTTNCVAYVNKNSHHIKILNIDTGIIELSLNILQYEYTGNIINNYNFCINNLCFSPNGEEIVTGNSDGSIRIWNIKNQNVTKLMSGANIIDIVYSYDGCQIASININQYLQIWNVKTGKSIKNFFIGSYGKPHCLSFSYDNNKLAYCSGRYISIYDINNNTTKQYNIIGTSQEVTTISFMPTSRLIDKIESILNS